MRNKSNQLQEEQYHVSVASDQMTHSRNGSQVDSNLGGNSMNGQAKRRSSHSVAKAAKNGGPMSRNAPAPEPATKRDNEGRDIGRNESPTTSNAEERFKFTLYISKPVAKEFKKLAIDLEQDYSALGEMAFKQMIENHQRKRESDPDSL